MAAGDFQGTYDLTKVVTTIGGVILTGFGEGDVITYDYEEERTFTKVGADGEVGVASNPSRLGTATFNLSQTSKANDELSALFNIGSLGSIINPVPVGSADLSGRSVAGGSKSWIKKTPPMTFGREIGEREWVFQVADLLMTFGGNG